MYLIAENSCNTWGAQQSLKLALIQGERGEQCHCDSTISLCDYFLSMATNNFIFLNTKCNSDVDNLYLCFKRPIGLMNKQILNKIQQQIIDIYQIQIIVQVYRVSSTYANLSYANSTYATFQKVFLKFYLCHFPR